MDIVFSANNREEVWLLPVAPPEVPIAREQANDTYNGLSMDVNIIGNPGLRTVEIASFFPVNKNYPFIKPGSEADGWLYVDFFERWRAKKVPIRIVITSKSGRELLNMACTVDNFEYIIDRAEDIAYTLSLREYVFVV